MATCTWSASRSAPARGSPRTTSRRTRPRSRSAVDASRAATRSRPTASGSAPAAARRPDTNVVHWRMQHPMATYLATVVIAPMREQRDGEPGRRRRSATTSRRRIVRGRHRTLREDGRDDRLLLVDHQPLPVRRVRRRDRARRPRLRAREPDDVGVRPRHARHRPGGAAHRRPRARAPVVRRLGRHRALVGHLAQRGRSPTTSSTCGWPTPTRRSTSTGRWRTCARRRPTSSARSWTPDHGGTFSASIYERGALAVHALRRTIGDAAFFTLLRRWTTEHRYGIGDDRPSSSRWPRR